MQARLTHAGLGIRRCLPPRSQLAELDEFQDKLKEVEGVCAPLLTRMYRQHQAQASPGQGSATDDAPHAHSEGPKVEEVD